MRHILKCADCSKYTMREKCGCGGKAVAAKPPKFSIEDSYGSYRRKAKFEDLKKRGLV